MSIAGTILGKIKNLVRTPWHRTLLKEGLEDDCGNPTAEGREVVLRMLAEEAYAGKREEIGKQVLERNKQIKAENE